MPVVSVDGSGEGCSAGWLVCSESNLFLMTNFVGSVWLWNGFG